MWLGCVSSDSCHAISTELRRLCLAVVKVIVTIFDAIHFPALQVIAVADERHVHCSAYNKFIVYINLITNFFDNTLHFIIQCPLPIWLGDYLFLERILTDTIKNLIL